MENDEVFQKKYLLAPEHAVIHVEIWGISIVILFSPISKDRDMSISVGGKTPMQLCGCKYIWLRVDGQD